MSFRLCDFPMLTFLEIIAKAWRDPAFKAELIANPAATLKAEGIDGVRYEC